MKRIIKSVVMKLQNKQTKKGMKVRKKCETVPVCSVI